MTEPRRLTVDANGVSLNLYAIGEESDGPPVIMLHGMRDVALSLMPVATRLAGQHPVYLPDLRGHGASDKPGGYSIAALVYDLHVAAVGDYISHDPTVRDDYRTMLEHGLLDSIEDHRIYNLAVRFGRSNPHHGVGYLIHPTVTACIGDWLD